MSIDADLDAGSDAAAGDPGSTVHYRYPGSPPFRDTELDRRLFRGRAAEADTVLHSILSSDLFLLYAVSGLGKTSLLNAGVMHELRARGHWPVSVRLNDTSKPPVVEIREQVEDAADADPEIDLQRDPNFEGELGPDSSLWDVLASLEVWRANKLQRLVVVFDQFEELFTLGWDDAVRQRFITELGEVVRGHRLDTGSVANGSGAPPEVKFVLVIREDALGELEALATDIPQIMRNRFRLGPLDLDQAEAAIREPALVDDGRLDTHPFTYTQAASREILDFLRTKADRGATVRTDSVDPSQLQIVCQYVERAILPGKGAPPPGGTLEIDESDLGGRAGLDRILGDFYRRTVQSFPTSRQRAVQHLCERGLINPSGRRLSLEEGEIQDAFDVSPDMLRQLVDERLLRADPRVGSVYYELAHDTLVAPILAYGQEQRSLQRRRRRWWIAIGAGVLALAAVSLLAYTAGSDSAPEELVAGRLTVGDTLEGSIDEPGAAVRFDIAPAPDEVLVATVSPALGGSGSGGDTGGDGGGADLNVVVELTDSSGVTRQQQQLPRGEPEHMVVPPASQRGADRAVRVTSFDSTTGPFEISLDELEVTGVAAGSSENGRIAEPGDLVVYRFESGGGAATVIEVVPVEPQASEQESDQDGRAEDDTKPPPGIDLELEVVDPAGVGDRIDDEGPGVPERALLGTTEGPYLLIVRGYQFSTGQFRVEAQEQVTALTPGRQEVGGALPAPAEAAGEIGASSDVMEFVYELPGDGRYALVTVQTDDESFDPMLDVDDPVDLSWTVDSGGPGGTEVAVIGDAEGTYVLKVRGYEGSTGTFTIEVNQQVSEALTPGQPASGELPSETDIAIFTSELAESDSFADVVVEPEQDFDPILDIIDPAGTTVTVDNGGDGGAEVAILGGAPGTYVLIVRGYESSTGGFQIVTHPLGSRTLEVGDEATMNGPAIFGVDVPSGEVVVFTALPAAEDAPVTIQVHDPDGFWVDESTSSTGGAASVFLDGGIATSYQVLVTSGGPIEYTATLAQLEQIALEPGEEVVVTGPTAFDVEVPSGSVLEFVADPLSDVASTTVKVTDPEGILFTDISSSQGEPASVILDDSLANTYEVLVTSSGGSGEYTASLTAS